VRELENAIERAFVLCPSGRIGVEHLPETIAGVRSGARPQEGCGLRDVRKAIDAQAIRAALERHGGNRAAAARELGVHKTTLFRKINALGLVFPTAPPPQSDPTRR
jgi:DNA-binding NtrC family response regulator